MLWCHWWNLVCELRPACARTRTFLWMALCLAGFSTRKDLLGVTSIVRALGLEPACYDRLLDFFHSPALDLNKLTRAWRALIFRFNSGILRVNRTPVLVGAGIKVAKAGRKMPGVKKLHQESGSNNKPEYIFGHSRQAVAVLTQALSSVFALPLAGRIHEGTVFSNRDHRTLLDKMILPLDSLRLNEPFYFVAERDGGAYEVQIRDTAGLPFSKDHPQPVRVGWSKEKVTRNHYRRRKLVAETTFQEWLWITTLDSGAFPAPQGAHAGPRPLEERKQRVERSPPQTGRSSTDSFMPASIGQRPEPPPEPPRPPTEPRN